MRAKHAWPWLDGPLTNATRFASRRWSACHMLTVLLNELLGRCKHDRWQPTPAALADGQAHGLIEDVIDLDLEIRSCSSARFATPADRAVGGRLSHSVSLVRLDAGRA